MRKNPRDVRTLCAAKARLASHQQGKQRSQVRTSPIEHYNVCIVSIESIYNLPEVGNTYNL